MVKVGECPPFLFHNSQDCPSPSELCKSNGSITPRTHSSSDRDQPNLNGRFLLLGEPKMSNIHSWGCAVGKSNGSITCRLIFWADQPTTGSWGNSSVPIDFSESFTLCQELNFFQKKIKITVK